MVLQFAVTGSGYYVFHMLHTNSCQLKLLNAVNNSMTVNPGRRMLGSFEHDPSMLDFFYKHLSLLSCLEINMTLILTYKLEALTFLVITPKTAPTLGFAEHRGDFWLHAHLSFSVLS